MKRLMNWRTSGTIILVLVAALLILLGSITVAARPAVDQEPTARTITVSGVGQASGTPDVATIQLGVDTQNTDPTQALDDANNTIQQVQDALISNGVSQQDIQTASFNMWQDTSSSQNSSTPSQPTYHVQDILRIKTQVDQAGSIISAAVGAGANNINSLSFNLSDPTALIQQARTQAITDAQNRAEQIAQLMGVTLGGPVTVTESDNTPSPVQPLTAAAAMTPVSGGQLSVTVNVNVSYAIGS